MHRLFSLVAGLLLALGACTSPNTEQATDADAEQQQWHLYSADIVQVE